MKIQLKIKSELLEEKERIYIKDIPYKVEDIDNLKNSFSSLVFPFSDREYSFDQKLTFSYFFNEFIIDLGIKIVDITSILYKERNFNYFDPYQEIKEIVTSKNKNESDLLLEEYLKLKPIVEYENSKKFYQKSKLTNEQRVRYEYLDTLKVYLPRHTSPYGLIIDYVLIENYDKQYEEEKDIINEEAKKRAIELLNQYFKWFDDNEWELLL